MIIWIFECLAFLKSTVIEKLSYFEQAEFSKMRIVRFRNQPQKWARKGKSANKGGTSTTNSPKRLVGLKKN